MSNIQQGMSNDEVGRRNLDIGNWTLDVGHSIRKRKQRGERTRSGSGRAFLPMALRGVGTPARRLFTSLADKSACAPKGYPRHGGGVCTKSIFFSSFLYTSYFSLLTYHYPSLSAPQPLFPVGRALLPAGCLLFSRTRVPVPRRGIRATQECPRHKGGGGAIHSCPLSFSSLLTPHCSKRSAPLAD